jgi:hypothetical protein
MATLAADGMKRQSLPIENSLFWIVYLVSAFEADKDHDFDPHDDVGTTVHRDRALTGYASGYDASFVFRETTRDVWHTSPSFFGMRPLTGAYSYVAAHEVAHQVVKDTIPPPEGAFGDPSHRIDAPNLLAPGTMSELFLDELHPKEIAKIRKQIDSP